MSGRAICIVTTCLLTYLIVVVKAEINKKSKYAGPQLDDEEFTTCEDLSRNARFNPYSVMDDIWVPFYYFAPTVTGEVFHFYAPTTKRKKLLQKLLNDTMTSPAVDWTKPIFVMKDIKRNESSLIVQMGDRGQFLRYPLIKNITANKWLAGEKIPPHHIQFKQTEGGKYLTFMQCKRQISLIMARPTDIPRKPRIQEEVAKVGIKSLGSLSYLYQGHRWMPIPEEDESLYPPGIFYMT